jgi:SAM-dependent methyltransferase
MPTPDATTAPSSDASASYAIQGGEVGRRRLTVLSGVLEATTSALLDRIGMCADARCLDTGCGGGDVTRLLAARAPDGAVLGVDRDPVKIALARAASPANVEWRVEDLADTVRSGERFDVVTARFVVSHLAGSAAWVLALAGLLAPGGVLVLEDVRMDGSFCSPSSGAFDRSLAVYCSTVRANGGDPNVGPHLPRFLAAAGLTDVGIEVVQPAAMHGDATRIQVLTFAAIRDAAIAAGVVTAVEHEAIANDLAAFVERPDSVVSTAQIVQAWAWRNPG